MLGTIKSTVDLPDESAMAQLSLDTVKVEKLVKEFLTAQSLTILPQNSFGDAVAQFVDKDDKHAMEMFVNESLESQLKHLMSSNDVDEEEIGHEMEQFKTQLEDLFASGQMKKVRVLESLFALSNSQQRKKKYRPAPELWDEEQHGPWEENPGALIHTDAEEEEDGLTTVRSKKPAPVRGKGKAAATTRPTAAPAKKAPAARGGRGKKTIMEEEEDVVDEDIVMISSENEEESEEDLFVRDRRTIAKKPPARAPARTKSPPKKTAATRTRAPATKQSTLNFSQTSSQRSAPRTAASRAKKAFEPVSSVLS